MIYVNSSEGMSQEELFVVYVLVTKAIYKYHVAQEFSDVAAKKDLTGPQAKYLAITGE